MIRMPLGKITGGDLRALIGTAREGKTLEFKSQMPAQTNEEKVKFLAAVSSLANTAGGDLLIGIEADDGLAAGISGIPATGLDAAKLQLENLLRDQLDPRLPRVDIAPVDVGGGRAVLVVRVAQSWLSPHKVRINEKFYGRNSAGRYPLDVGELRTAFVASESAVERIRGFRTERLIKIAARETPLALPSGPTMIVHVVPLSTFASRRSLDIVREIAGGHVMPVPPGRTGRPNNHAINLDGLATFNSPVNEPLSAYAQAFRSGAVEGVDLLDGAGEGGYFYLAASTFEATVLSTVKNYIMLTQDLDLGYPVFAALSLTGMTRCRFRVAAAGGFGYQDHGPLTQDVLALPEAVIESRDEDISVALRPVFNTVWNAFGFAKSENYDHAGRWTGRQP